MHQSPTPNKTMNATDFSQKTHQEAENILSQTNVMGLLSKFGNARIGGSFYTGLMYGPDIDITVATNKPRESAVEFLNEIINKRSFQKYQYGDFEKHPRENRPKAHIVVLISPFFDRRWEIEIWFTDSHSKDQIELEEKLKNLSQEEKTKIVELKARCEESGLDKHTLSSFEIYKKFLV